MKSYKLQRIAFCLQAFERTPKRNFVSARYGVAGCVKPKAAIDSGAERFNVGYFPRGSTDEVFQNRQFDSS